MFHAVLTVMWPSKSSRTLRGLAGRECRVKARAWEIPPGMDVSTVLGCRQQQETEHGTDCRRHTPARMLAAGLQLCSSYRLLRSCDDDQAVAVVADGELLAEVHTRATRHIH